MPYSPRRTSALVHLNLANRRWEAQSPQVLALEGRSLVLTPAQVAQPGLDSSARTGRDPSASAPPDLGLVVSAEISNHRTGRRPLTTGWVSANREPMECTVMTIVRWDPAPEMLTLRDVVN